MAANGIFDEMYGWNDQVQPPYAKIAEWLKNTPPELFASKLEQAELLFQKIGITFNVYGSAAGTERLIPFDIIPRILSAKEWQKLQAGLFQRVRALQMFLHDIYHDQDIMKAGIIPASHILRNEMYRPEMKDVNLAGNIYVQIAGIDVVRVAEGEFYVLEDNLRTPSGVSYMLEDRAVMMRLFPKLFQDNRVAPVDHYPAELVRQLRSVAPERAAGSPTVAVLTPGPYNSAYFEHAFLADEMGIELVKGSDLFVDEGRVYMRTPRGPQRVDVIYRRVDDAFLDPLAMRPDSYLGVAGLLGALRAGRVNIVTALGNGVADDKATYTYVPERVRF